MTKTRLTLFDTTLALDELGIDYIEGGWPGANPVDTEFFERPPQTRHAKFLAFGMTKRAGRSAENDETLAGVLNAGTNTVCLVGKSHVFHVENIRASLAHCGAQGREALFDAEHFFDGYRADPDYALSCLDAAAQGGARWLVLCDTNGGTLPGEIAEVTAAACARFGGERIGIHTHNDTEHAVANSFAAVDAGARQIQGTLNGLGERCGNANLVSIIPTLLLKQPYADQFEKS